VLIDVNTRLNNFYSDSFRLLAILGALHLLRQLPAFQRMDSTMAIVIHLPPGEQASKSMHASWELHRCYPLTRYISCSPNAAPILTN